MSALIIMKVVIIVVLVFTVVLGFCSQHMTGGSWRGGSPPQGDQVSSVFVAGHCLSPAAPGSHGTCRFAHLPELFINVMNWLYTSGISAAHLQLWVCGFSLKTPEVLPHGACTPAWQLSGGRPKSAPSDIWGAHYAAHPRPHQVYFTHCVTCLAFVGTCLPLCLQIILRLFG